MFSVIEKYVNIVIVVLCVVLFFAAVLYIAAKLGKKSRKLKSENADYSKLNRRSTRDFVKIDDIRNNMIVTDNGKRFVGVIKCRGTDFYYAAPDEQAGIINSYREAFTNTVTEPITYRQYCKGVDLESSIERYNVAFEELSEKAKELEVSLKSIDRELSKGSLSKEEVMYLHAERAKLCRKRESYEARLFHLTDQIEYLESFGGANTQPEQVETYEFDWTYNSNDFDVELTPEQIEIRAVQELNGKANSLIHVLSSCGVKAVRCTTMELIEMTRRYSCPVSADTIRIRDIENSNYFDDITASDSANEMVSKIREEIAQKAISSDEGSSELDEILFGNGTLA